METIEDMYKWVEKRLDADYVARVGRAVADALRDDEPIEVNYQPGDGTSYRLVFTPVQDLRCAPPRVAPMRGHTDEMVEWDDRCPLGVSRRVGGAIVSWVGKSAEGLDLAVGGFVGVYLAGLFGTTDASGVALSMLFDAVAKEIRG